jgi:hypothetical protein
MRSAHSRLAFVALDNLIDQHYIQSMRKREPMTLDEAVEIVKNYTGCGNLLLDGLEQIKHEMQQEDADDWLSQREIAAYRFICRKMRPLFFGE